ncbi:MAG: holo-ACP synthase [Acidobacteria bacterium]|uniref:Holo-[acyl-carrier-protein] synthase n=1 Tax=Candidatus Polarisedimenticola svalbardensis TaxID=2886004 RepID=A0A8J7C1E7_9BACT|nr:holo-ACP synthase [Candidatus Polarisedimenticola svalbardensis]
MIVGIGIDLVEVARIRREVERHGDGVLLEVLTPGELDYCRSLARPYPSLAARFAAKEALFKALGSGKRDTMSWQDLTVRRNDLGKPDLALTGATAEAVRTLAADRVHLSLTHTEDHALAAVVLEKAESG